jgi:MFS family permease
VEVGGGARDAGQATGDRERTDSQVSGERPEEEASRARDGGVTVAQINPFRTLQRHRNFRIFWFGQTLSLVGTWMQQMAQGWLALELTDSAFMVGLVASAQSIPIVVFSLHAGVIVDRKDKLRLVRMSQAFLMVIAAVLFWLTWANEMTIGRLLMLAAATGLVSALEIPARQSLVIELVGREDLRSAIALNSSGFNLARIVGPAVAALVIANMGIAWAFGLNAISYLAVLAGLFMVRLPAWVPPSGVLATPLEGIREGLRYMRDTPTIAALMKLVTVYSVLGVPYLALMPVIAREMLGLGAAGYGLLLTAIGVGGLAGALWLAARGDLHRRGVLLMRVSIAFPALLILFAFVRWPIVAYPLLFAIGFTMIVNNALANGLLQQIVPDAMRGRLMAAYSLIVVGLSQAVGALAAGAIARALAIDWAIGIASVAMVAYGVWAFRSNPRLRRL